jgi:hypothetical protein
MVVFDEQYLRGWPEAPHQGFWSSPQEPEGNLTAIQSLFFPAENVMDCVMTAILPNGG